MSILKKDYEKIKNLDKNFFKKKINAELLHIHHADNLNIGADLEFELKILEKQYNKNLYFLDKVNNENKFFENSLDDITLKSKNILDASKKLIRQIYREYDSLKNDTEYKDTFNTLYSSTMPYAKDFLNGDFLFINKFSKIFDLENTAADEYIRTNFENLFSAIDTLNTDFFLRDEFLSKIYPITAGIDQNSIDAKEGYKSLFSKKAFLNNLLNSIDSSQVGSGTYRLKFVKYLNNYLGLNLKLNNSNHIDRNVSCNSLNMISQVIFNISEQEDYSSTNSLLYGLFPTTKENEKNLSFQNTSLINLPIFLKDAEVFSLKKMKRNSVLHFEERINQRNDLYRNISALKIDPTKVFMSESENSISRQNLDNINLNERFSNFKSFINMDTSKEYKGLSNVFLQNKFQFNSSNLSRNVKSSLDFFKNKNTMFSQFDFQRTFFNVSGDINSRPTDPPIYNEPESNSEYSDYAIDSGLSLMSLINQYVDTKNIHILKIKKIKTKPILRLVPIEEIQDIAIDVNQPIPEIQVFVDLDKMKNIANFDDMVNNLDNLSGLDIQGGWTGLDRLRGLDLQRDRGGLLSLNQSNLNLQGGSAGRGARARPRGLELAVANSDTNNFDIEQTQKITGQEVYISYIYESKKNIIEEKSGILNFNHFNESSNFSSSVIKNRFLVNDCIKSLKRIISRKKQEDVASYLLKRNTIEKDTTQYMDRLNIDADSILAQQDSEKVEYSLNEKIDSSFISGSDIILNSNFILKKNEILNENSNVDFVNIRNANIDFFDLSKDITENDIKDKFSSIENNEKVKEILSKKTKNVLDSVDFFNSSTRLFSKIKDEIKNIFDQNLTNDDHKFNFSKRAELTEIASLLWSINPNSTGIDSEKKKEIRNTLTDSLCFLLANSTDSLSNAKKSTFKNEMSKIFQILSNDDSIELLTDISPFYMFANNLNSQSSYSEDYEAYDPYSKNKEDPEFIEQNGSYQHFLFSNFAQGNYYKFIDKAAQENLNYSRIEEYPNTFNANKASISPFYICESFIQNQNKFFIKNIFNLDYFKPFLRLIEFNGKKAFMVSSTNFDKTLFKSTFDKIVYACSNMKNSDIESVFPDKSDRIRYSKYRLNDYDIILNDAENIILKESILNIAVVENSIFDNNIENNKLYLMLKNILGALFRELNISVTNFSDISSANSVNIKDFKNIVTSILQISSDIFCRMFHEIQGNVAITNRAFESSFLARYFFEDFQGVSNPLNTRTYLDNYQILISFAKLCLKKQSILLPAGRIFFDSINEKIISKFDNGKVQNFKSAEGLSRSRIFFGERPSTIKFLYFLTETLGLDSSSIKKIYYYLSTNRNFVSKHSNVFDYFNLYKEIDSRKIFLIENCDAKTQNNVEISAQGNPKHILNQNYIAVFDACFLSMQIKENSQIPGTIIWDFFEKTSQGNAIKTPDVLIYFSNPQNIANNNKYNNVFAISDIFSNFYWQNVLYFKKERNDTPVYSFFYNNLINCKHIFENIISPSFQMSYDFQNFENQSLVDNENENKKNVSGCLNIIENFKYANSNLNQYYFIKIANQEQKTGLEYCNEILNPNTYPNDHVTNDIFIDLNHNWFNQISRGLIINDISYAINTEIFKYFNSYEKGIGADTWQLYNKLKTLRETNTVSQDKETIKSSTGFDKFIVDSENTELKDLYLHSVMKYKSLKNIKDFYLAVNKDYKKTIKKFSKEIINEKFVDDYIRKNISVQNITGSNTILQPDKAYINNHATNIEGSTIFSIGIENTQKFSLNDIVVLEIDMFDNDFPQINWETKRFEFDMKLNNPIDSIFSTLNSFSMNTTGSINNISSFLKFPLRSYRKTANTNNFIYNSLVSATSLEANMSADIKNLTNNIFGNDNLNVHETFDVGIITSYDDYLEKRKSELLKIYEGKFNIANLDSSSRDQITSDLVKRCMYNQLMSYRLQKILKITSGFEPSVNFSIKKEEEKFLQENIILKGIYDFFLERLTLNQGTNNFEDVYGFNLEEFQKSLETQTYSYKGYEFLLPVLSTNNNINILMNFMSSFTKSMVPDFAEFATSNFHRIFNVAIKPEDFIATTLDYQEREIPILQSHTNLSFDTVINLENENEPLKDEIKTNYQKSMYNFIYADNIDRPNTNLTIHRVKLDGAKYSPRNVSYRIKVSILDN